VTCTNSENGTGKNPKVAANLTDGLHRLEHVAPERDEWHKKTAPKGGYVLGFLQDFLHQFVTRIVQQRLH
jgi:hypothetical protein